MGLDDIGDKVRERTKKERAEELGLNDIESLEDIDEIHDRLNSISQSHVSQDKRIEDLEDEVETLWEVIKILLEKLRDGDETDEHLGMGDRGESEEETRASDGPDDWSDTIGDDDSEREYAWLTDDE